MNPRLAGKTCLVTAAAQGIGRAIAEAFLREGAEVIAIDLKAEGLATLSGMQTATVDATDTAAVAALAARYPNVSVLVNCVGYVAAGTLLETDADQLERSFRINVISMHNAIAAFLPAMRTRRDGSIINIASGSGSVRGIPNRYVYGATKAAVIGLTKAVAADYIRHGVRANAICPGTIQSPSLDGRIADLAKSTGKTLAEARQMFIDRQPMGRLGTAEEVAMLAVYLASDEATYTTGQIHLVDGGFAL